MATSAAPLERPTARVQMDRWIHSVERHYLARAAVCEVVREGWSELELASIAEDRWWSAGEMQSSGDIFVPRRLPSLLPGILEGALPEEPIDVGV